jgi:hypothetical protein
MTMKSQDGPLLAGRGNSIKTSTVPSITRRALLAGAAFSFAGFAWQPAGAQSAAPTSGLSGFLDVSRAITGKSDLSPMTADRIYAALQADDAGFEGRLAQIVPLVGQTGSPDALKAAASAIGLGDTLTAIITAWYTGTVETGKGPVVVSYADALMYRPVADGLTVPTYCNKGPLWWTGLPPEITTMPNNYPKVL